MVSRRLPRRAVLAGVTAIVVGPGTARAGDYIDLKWEDLLPRDQSTLPNALRGFFDHDEEAPMFSEQPASTGTRADWNQQIVRLSGFVVPLDYSGTGVTAFILVPYVGACVHVPPPPANQLVFVTTSEPYESDGLFEAVRVIGRFGVSTLTTQLGEIGYALAADRIEPHRT